MARSTIAVQGLDCSVEAAEIRRALEDVPGIFSLDFDLARGRLTITHNPSQCDQLDLVARINQRTGLPTRLIVENEAEQRTAVTTDVHDSARDQLRRWLPVAASGALLALGIALAWTTSPRAISRGLFGFAIAVAAIELLPRAWHSLSRLRLDIHVLITAAVTGAVILGQWDEAATLAFLFCLAEALEAMSLERARKAVRALLEIAPQTAERILPDGTTRVVPAADVQVGDRVVIRAGDKIPIDGRVRAGRSSVDQKAITGESLPVLREPDDEVFAGTVNGEGTLEVEATRPLSDSVVTRIVERVRAAQRGRTPIEQTVDRFAAVYTPIVVALAVATMLLPPLVLSGADRSWWFYQGLVILVIACPCALVIATPVAIVSALAAAARRGILIKSGQFLELVGRLRVLAFDKTGTLTRGEPAVVEVVPVSGRRTEDLLRVAAALGDRGGHVLGRAIAAHARRMSLDVPLAVDYQAVPGLGASALVDSTQYHMGSHRFIDDAGLCPPEFHARVNQATGATGTAVLVTSGRGPLGWFRLADRPRVEAAAAIRQLSSLGVEPVMLTGDNRATAEAVASDLGITDHRAGLLPEEKAAAVSQLDRERGPAGMVGDGVNDAPALAVARVSVALGGISSGAAIESADIVLMSDDLGGLPWLVRHSRRTLGIIRANIALAIGSKAIVLVLALLGKSDLWMAIAADMGVSLIVVANALRLLRPESQSSAKGA
jgi:Cd2+/Zn2+-exporting ATPase